MVEHTLSTVGADASPLEQTRSLSSGSSTQSTTHVYLIIHLPGASISSHAQDWSMLLNESGLVSCVASVSQVLATPSNVGDASAIILDASVGSGNGTVVTESLIDLLVREDRPLIITGRAAWISHRLRGSGSPLQTAPASDNLTTVSGFENAVFLISPNLLTIPSLLTTESGIVLPRDATQTETSRLINLTGADDSSELSPLRYDSYPLDQFLFGPENPADLTDAGKGLLLNIIAFSTSLRESATTQAIASWQDKSDSLTHGGFFYPHEPTLKVAYYAVHSVHDLLDASAWSSWRDSHQAVIGRLLNSTMMDFGANIGFKNAASSSSDTIVNTAQGLWLISIMELSSSFNTSKIVAYLSSSQDTDGGFDSDVIVTHVVTEALASAGQLNSIDTTSLESWLRSCVIDGSKTTDNTLWGGIAQNPSSISPTNSYARAYVLSLEILGETHNDPQKLTNWILQYTANGDGSYSDTPTSGVDVSIGTGAALTTMQILGTLSPQNRTTGLSWLADNQVPSGGFGLGYVNDDIVGKTQDTSYVSYCLARLGESSGQIATGIIEYVNNVETSLGFERMGPVPSLMWTYWLMQDARFSHSSNYVDYQGAGSFLSLLDGWKQYPYYSNMSYLIPLEYGPTQYRTQSVWTHYFGISASSTADHVLTTAEIDETTTFIVNSQDMSGHFRPTMFIGTPSMQHSTVAVEVLYQLGRLDQIQYRSELETAILSAYNGGTWSTAGWDIRPFDVLPTAIDWLSTRAALRLGILNSSLVSEITATIQARVQYQDLLALSFDVATLALLEANGCNASVDIIDAEQVLTALGPNPFSSGWFNETTLWQPLYTASILRMVSILGLRPRIFEGHSCSLSVSTATATEIGSTLSVNVSVTSGTTNHSITVYSFGSWTMFSNLSDSDTLSIPVPRDAGALGMNDLYFISSDYGSVRASQRLSVEVDGHMNGTFALDDHDIRIGDPITGVVDWQLTTGMPAGITNITVRLGDPPTYHEWYYQDVSPFNLSIPTDGFNSGQYNLTVTLSRAYCSDLVLHDVVQLYIPVSTYIDTISALETDIGNPVLINWTLRYSENDTAISGKSVLLQIADSNGDVVYTATETDGQFEWTPTIRGRYSFNLTFDGEKALAPSNSTGTIDAYEVTALDMLTASQYDQNSNVTLSVTLHNDAGYPFVNQSVTFVLKSPSSITVVHTTVITDASGHASITVYLSENGWYTLTTTFESVNYLRSSTNSSQFLSFSSTTLALGGIASDGHVGTDNSYYVSLTDSANTPVAGVSVIVTITYLPTTTVETYDLTTNSSGLAAFSWTATSAGSYSIHAEFAGTVSYGASDTSQTTDMWIPVTLTIIVYTDPEVNVTGWISITAEDHLEDAISGLDVSLIVTAPSSLVMLQSEGTTGADGVWTCVWTPEERGFNNVTVNSIRQNWYEAALSTRMIGVYETPTFNLSLPNDPVAPTTAMLLINVIDGHSDAVAFCSVHTTISLDDVTILDVTNTTDASGQVVLEFDVNEPGILKITTTFSKQGWFLSTSDSLTTTVAGVTTLSLTTPGQPVSQGTTIGILVSLTDWAGDPLGNVQVLYTISWANGTTVHSENKTTDVDGTCLLAYPMSAVGDFLINASYSGSEGNAPSSQSNLQRVYVIPDVISQFDSVFYLNATAEILVGVRDAMNHLVSGRTLQVSVEQDGSTVFDTQVISQTTLVSVTWQPTKRGIVTIHVLHVGDLYYYTNETSSTSSVMEIVSGDLTLSSTEIEFEGSVNMTYRLTSTNSSGVVILFHVLGVDLVPIWNSSVMTNASGIAVVEYHAVDATGILTLRVGPVEDQYMLGGDVQTQMTVMTDAQITTTLTPDPPCAGEAINITITVVDELGVPLDDLTLVVTARDPYGELVKLGSWSYSVSVQTDDGVAIVSLTTNIPGLHTIEVQSSGSTFVHAFDISSQHIVFSRTVIEIVSATNDLEVGQSFLGMAILKNHDGVGMSDRDVSLVIDGPGSAVIGPITLTTNATGYVEWNVTIDQEGVWQATLSFEGLGVYLASVSTVSIDVRFHVTLSAEVISSDAPVAGLVPLVFSLKLADASDTVLEGFTISYSIYHESVGLVIQESVIQESESPVNVSILLPLGGHYSILIEFRGTSHYFPASIAIATFVYGTTRVEFSFPSAIEISQPAAINVSVVNEVEAVMTLSEVDMTVTLHDDHGAISLDDRTVMNGTQLSIDLQGLSVGRYNLTVSIPNTSEYLGYSGYCVFNITAQTHFVNLTQDLSGIIGVEHSLTFVLQDSLETNLTGISVMAYVYDPNGKEILGGIFHSGSDISLTDAGATISWLPAIVGVYTLHLFYTGNGYLLSASFEVKVLTRKASTLHVDMPDTVPYGDDILMIATLRDSSGPLRNVPVECHLFLRDTQVLSLNSTTDWTGIAKFGIVDLLAGNYTVIIFYQGSSTHVPVQVHSVIAITPNLAVHLLGATDTYEGANVTANVSIRVFGVASTWIGSIEISIASPSGRIVSSTSHTTSPMDTVVVNFIAPDVGQYTLCFMVKGLPVVGQTNSTLQVGISAAPSQIMLDSSTSSLALGLPILAVIGLLVRKKISQVFRSIPTEWHYRSE
ncbi:MAG: prenyltransferase/squalene oxidase repeat-containing protein [Candidatus Thorarchaeota archaeon]